MESVVMGCAKRVMMMVAVAAPALAMAADTVSLSAGRWEETITRTKATLNDVPLPVSRLGDSETIKYSCVSPEAAADPAKYFLRHEAGDDCRPSGTVANGRISASADCMSGEDKRLINIRVAGTYGSRAYEADAATDVAIDEGKLAIELKVRGRFVGACKGDETG